MPGLGAAHSSGTLASLPTKQVAYERREEEGNLGLDRNKEEAVWCCALLGYIQRLFDQAVARAVALFSAVGW